MADKNLPDPAKFVGRLVGGNCTIGTPLASGHNGIVYSGTMTIAGHQQKVAVKCVPQANLRAGWDSEIKKPLVLPPALHVVRPIDVITFVEPGETRAFVFIIMPWIEGTNLRKYLKDKRELITHCTVSNFTKEMLAFLHGMRAAAVTHGDIHAGNILVEYSSENYIDGQERFWLTDFGIGNSLNNLPPKDDFKETALIIRDMVSVAKENTADGLGRHVLDQISDWLIPKLADTNPSSIHQPRELALELEKVTRQPFDHTSQTKRLATPFDYMSCEQLGQQYGLLQRLFSLNFPNCPDLLERGNTVLTGPRGCGKTMILRSLATKSQVLGGKTLDIPLQRFGVYYHCNDLFYAFPHTRNRFDESMFRGTVHYFNLAILYDTIDSLLEVGAADPRLALDHASVRQFVEWLSPYIQVGMNSTDPVQMLNALKAQIAAARKRTKDQLSRAPNSRGTDFPTGLAFLSEAFHVLASSVPWLNGVPIFVFLDDYSLPRVSANMQGSLNRVIFQRGAEVFFKVATESITTLHPYDSEMKLLEVEREYSVIDLGSSFMQAGPDEKRKFIEEVLNTRFDAADAYRIPNIDILLGDPNIAYNEAARQIRANEKFKYNGFATVVDMCSGDITHTLRLVRDMIANSGGLERFKVASSAAQVPIDVDVQHKAISKLGADFLANIEAAPLHGPMIRKIVNAFGELAHWELMNITSQNEGGSPPKQSFRIEIRDALAFDNEPDLEEVYQALLRYGVFIRDVTGKSLRSAVVPRLYLRRLLVPLFRLTFSKRDNVGMEVQEFKELLRNPDRFKEARISKRRTQASSLDLFGNRVKGKR